MQVDAAPGTANVAEPADGIAAAPQGDGPTNGITTMEDAAHSKVQEHETTDEDGADDEEDKELMKNAAETIYINNLNERIKLKTMKISLRVLFKVIGPVVDVTVNQNIRMRGQAFVTFSTVENAKRAVKEVNKFPLYGRPMQITFAKTPSEELVKRKTPELFEEFHNDRLIRKKKGRKDNPLRRKSLAQREAAKKAVSGTETGAGAGRRAVQMPEEYLPPNRILFVQNLPDSITKERLEEVFGQYPNLTEVRTIPGRKDIAFVEYMDTTSSTPVKEALHNQKLDDEKMKVSFARQ